MQHRISTLCRVLRVNRSTYYKHFFGEKSKRLKDNANIKIAILELYNKHKLRLGAFSMNSHLLRDYGIKVSVGRVYRLMKSMNLPKMSTIKQKPNYSIIAIDESLNLHNLLKQQFDQTAPNLVWCGDFTYINIGKNRFVYLCVIIDLFSRKIIAYTVSAKHNAQMAIETFKKAYYSRNCPKSLMFHSDQGSEYTSKEYRMLMDNYAITQSFSKKGHPYDNAVMECFFKYAKKEEFDRHSYTSLEEVKSAAFEYIEGYYNSNRFHSYNNNKTPNQKEKDYFGNK